MRDPEIYIARDMRHMRHTGLTGDEGDALAEYNSERARGLVHTPEWQMKMAALQDRFDAHMAPFYEQEDEQ